MCLIQKGYFRFFTYSEKKEITHWIFGEHQLILNRALELAEFICTLPQPAIRTDKEAAVRGFGESLDEGLRIEAEKFLGSIYEPETIEGLKQFNERLHPDRQYDATIKTPGIVRKM